MSGSERHVLHMIERLPQCVYRLGISCFGVQVLWGSSLCKDSLKHSCLSEHSQGLVGMGYEGLGFCSRGGLVQ